MSHEVIKGKGFHWHHFSELEDADFEMLEKEFKFHPLDFDDLRDETELPKLDIYKYYLLIIFAIPTFDSHNMRVGKKNLSIFIGKNYVVTATREAIESVDRFFVRAKRSRGLRQEALGKNSGYLMYRLLDYVFRDAKVILQELVREANNVEASVYDARTEVTTRRLGMVRRNVLYMRHVLDPQRILIGQIMNANKTYLSRDLHLYYDDVKDTLDAMWVVTDNLKNIMDGLFDVNEAFLSHRTNEIIRLLTIISVLLMPPTLITGYYGMNVEQLPFSNSVTAITLIILFSILLLILVIFRIDRKR